MEVTGNLGGDPVIETIKRKDGSGSFRKAKFNIAVNTGSKFVDGQWQNLPPSWTTIVMLDDTPSCKLLFDSISEAAGTEKPFIRKGTNITIAGYFLPVMFEYNDKHLLNFEMTPGGFNRLIRNLTGINKNGSISNNNGGGSNSSIDFDSHTEEADPHAIPF